jgi:hypothetical protein
MKISEQVCSLEQAKKLKELGVNIETLHCFTGSDCGNISSLRDAKAWMVAYAWNYYAAPNVAELGVLLPSDIFVDGYCVFEMEQLGKHEPHWLWRGEKYNTEAQARAEALISLIEEKFVKPEDLKL